MGRIVSQLVLAMLLLPALALAYMVMFVLLEELTRLRDEGCFLFAGLATFLLMIACWTLLWKSTVTWTARRIGLTFGMTVAVAIVSLAVAWPMGAIVTDGFGYFFWGAMASVLWPIVSILIWRETKRERMVRLGNSTGGRAVLSCPVCNYDLADQREAKCPECGGVFTLGSLMAAGDRDSESSISAGA